MRVWETSVRPSARLIICHGSPRLGIDRTGHPKRAGPDAQPWGSLTYPMDTPRRITATPLHQLLSHLASANIASRKHPGWQSSKDISRRKCIAACRMHGACLLGRQSPSDSGISRRLQISGTAGTCLKWPYHIRYRVTKRRPAMLQYGSDGSWLRDWNCRNMLHSEWDSNTCVHMSCVYL